MKVTIDQLGIPAKYQTLVRDDLRSTTNPVLLRQITQALMRIDLPTSVHSPVLVHVELAAA